MKEGYFSLYRSIKIQPIGLARDISYILCNICMYTLTHTHIWLHFVWNRAYALLSTRCTILSSSWSEIISLCWCFSDKQRVKQRSRCCSTQCGYSHFAFSQVLLSSSWLYKHKRSPTCVHSVSRMCGPALPNTQSVFSAAIRTERLLQPFAAWSPVRHHLRRAGGKMNASHVGTLN